MDFSIKNIKNTQKLNFQGVKGDLDSKNTPIFRFSLPSYKSNETPTLEITFLERETNRNGRVVSNNYIPTATMELELVDGPTIEIPQEMFKEYDYPAFAYRYVFESDTGEKRYALDGTKKTKINGENQNIIEIGDNYGLTPASGAMRHSFLDSDGIDIEKLSADEKKFIRTHSNKLGGSIKGLTYLLKKGFFDAYKYIISTPDIGADPTSPHKYWPNNQYQCGNMDDFKEFNLELFKEGKGYVADGAFTSQSLQSPLVHHVLKWGQDSPFYHMLKMDKGTALGVLPEDREAYNHVGVKLINAPNSENYNKNKPTLMQFFDDRTASAALQNDTQKIIDKYDIPNPQDHYDIVTYQNSVHPFYFEIQDRELAEKLSIFENGKNTVLLKDLGEKELQTLLSVGTDKVINRYNAANATFWDGNVDIVKMNLSNPDVHNPENIKGFFEARNYLYGVATFWTEAIQSNLILETAKLSEKEIEKIAYKNAITKEDFEEIKKNINDEETTFPVLQQNKTVQQYVEEFPLQSIETSPELSAIFSQPQFKEELLKGATKDYLATLVNQTIDNIVPDKYKNDKDYKAYVAKTCSNEILRHIFINAMSSDVIDKNGNINLDKLKDKVTLKSLLKYPPTTVADERRQVVQRIEKNIKPENTTQITQKLKQELSNITLEDFKLADSIVLQAHGGLNWRFDAAKDISDLEAVKNGTATFSDLWNGTSQAPGTQDFWKEFVTRIKQYNPSSYIIAEITNFGEFVAWNNLESMLKYDSKITNTFLSKIRDEIYSIEQGTELAELSDIFADPSKPESQRVKAFDRAKEIMDGRDDIRIIKEYENNVPYSKEQEFLEQIGAATSSNYDKYFNNLSKFAGVDPEHGQGDKNAAGDLNKLRNNTIRLMQFSQPNGILLSHVFVDNHDKPRLLHTLPLDMTIFVKSLEDANNLSNIPDEIKEKIEDLTGREDINNISSQAAAVGLAMKEKIEELYKNDDDKKQALLASLKNLVNGEKDGIFSPTRARAFGTLPYEVTIEDLFKGANINDSKEIEKFNYEFLKNSMDTLSRLWQVIGALAGVPTTYYGTDYAQTGYETSSKNVLVGNRGRALHERREGIFKDYYNKINAINSLSNNLDLTALKNSLPELLKITTKEGIDFFPIYRKDEYDSEVLSVLTNFGIEKNQFSKDHELSQKKVEVDSIAAKDDNDYCPFNDNQILRRFVYDEKLGKYVKENTQYIVKNGEIKRKDGQKIIINDTVSTFFVDRKRTPKFVPVYNSAH